MLTGLEDLDYIILNNLNDNDLLNIFLTNKYFNSIGNNDNFWLNRIITRFPLCDTDHDPIEIMTKYKNTRTWSEYYIDLRKINPFNANQYLLDGSKNGRYDHVIVSINHGADVHIQHDYPVRLASWNGHLNIVKYLVNHGANVNTFQNQAIRWAKIMKRTDIVEYLGSF